MYYNEVEIEAIKLGVGGIEKIKKNSKCTKFRLHYYF